MKGKAQGVPTGHLASEWGQEVCEVDGKQRECGLEDLMGQITYQSKSAGKLVRRWLSESRVCNRGSLGFMVSMTHI